MEKCIECEKEFEYEEYIDQKVYCGGEECYICEECWNKVEMRKGHRYNYATMEYEEYEYRHTTYDDYFECRECEKMCYEDDKDSYIYDEYEESVCGDCSSSYEAPEPRYNGLSDWERNR